MARDIEIGDVVIVHGTLIGKVVHRFLSATGEEVFDVRLAGYRRVAALENDIVVNLRPE
jgi:hypothetical protein